MDSIADRLEGKAAGQAAYPEEAFDRLQQTLRAYDSEQLQKTQGPQLETLLLLGNKFKRSISSLNEQIWPPDTPQTLQQALGPVPPVPST